MPSRSVKPAAGAPRGCQLRRASPGAAARLLGLPDPDRAWTVLPLLITRRVEPAAFTTNPAVTFVVCEDLTAVLQDPGDPPPGQAS
jgi:hypothetical protein